MARTARTLILTLACALAALPAAAHAGTVGASSVWAGGSAYLTLDLAAPAKSCRLVARPARGAARVLATLSPVQQARVAWVWQVPRAAASASWSVNAICGTSTLSTTLRVHGQRRRGALTLAQQVRSLQFGGTFPAPDVLQKSGIFDSAQSWWRQTGSSILAQFHQGASAGQCTDYVAAHRPDVIQSVDTAAYTHFLLRHGGSLGIDWTARYWAQNANAAGMPTGHIPLPGAVMVFQPGAYGATGSGHVALVESVGGSGAFTISEMHAPDLGKVHTRTFTLEQALAMLTDPRVSFVYG